MKNLIRVSEAAKRIDCSRAHVYNLIAAGELPRYDVSVNGTSRGTRVSDEDVDAYIERALQPIPAHTA